MRDRYVVVRAHVANDATGHATEAAALAEAVRAVEKDQVPRVVLRAVADVRASAVRRIDVVPTAPEVAHG